MDDIIKIALVQMSMSDNIEENWNRYDASPFIDRDGTILGVSKMVHIVQAEQFYEQDYYTPSEEGFKVYDTSI